MHHGDVSSWWDESISWNEGSCERPWRVIITWLWRWGERLFFLLCLRRSAWSRGCFSPQRRVVRRFEVARGGRVLRVLNRTGCGRLDTCFLVLGVKFSLDEYTWFYTVRWAGCLLDIEFWVFPPARPVSRRKELGKKDTYLISQ